VPDPEPRTGLFALLLLLAGLTFLLRRLRSRKAFGGSPNTGSPDTGGEPVSASPHWVRAVASPGSAPLIEVHVLSSGRSAALGVRPRTSPMTISVQEAADE
jgi:hypothetical protein